MTKKEVQQTVELWQERLGLQNWDITCYFKKIPNSKEAERQRAAVIAQININDRYHWADIAFDSKQMHKIQEDTIVHELCHIITDPLVEYVDSNIKNPSSTFDEWKNHFNEKAVSQFAKIIRNAYR